MFRPLCHQLPINSSFSINQTKHNNMKTIHIIIIAAIGMLWACEKEIDIDMPDYESSLVIEGFIINGMQPVVTLTNSVPFSSESGFEQYENSFVHNALVTVTFNENTTDTLIEIENRNENSGLTTYMYSTDKFVGEVGGTYQLNVTVNGENYTATATIPEPVPIKEIWYEDHPEEDNEDLKIVWIKIDDPIGANYYRYTSEVNGNHGPQPEISTVSDEAFDGMEYSKAVDSGLGNEDQDMHGGVSGYFEVGDTVTVKWINCEKSYYNMWTSIDFKRTQSLNPFLSPTPIKGNIDGALGYWSGLGASVNTVILK